MKLLRIGLLIVLGFFILSCSDDTSKGIAYTVTNGGYKLIDYTTESQTEDGQLIYHFAMFDKNVDLISEIISAHKKDESYSQVIYLNKDISEKVIPVMPGVNCSIIPNNRNKKVKNSVEYVPYGDTQKIKIEYPNSSQIRPGTDTITLKTDGYIKDNENIEFRLIYYSSTRITTDYLWFLK